MIRSFGVRIAAALLGAAIAREATASFELLLVLDAGTKSVHRFDSQTGAYFGSFGAGWLVNPQCIALDRSRSLAYVYDSAGAGVALKFDYNTGETKGVLLSSLFAAPAHMTVMSNGNIAFAGSSAAAVVTPTGSLAFNMASAGVRGGIGQAPDGNLYVVDMSARNVGRFSPTTGALLASGVALPALAGEGQMAFAGGDGFYAQGTNEIVTFNTVTLKQNERTVSPMLSIASISTGHDNILYLGGKNTGGTAVIQKYYPSVSLAGPQFGSGILSNPIGTAIVVAPEPGSLAGMGLGLAAIMRRRRLSRPN